jgi:hypothetical protein
MVVPWLPFRFQEQFLTYIPHIAGRILAPVLACGYEAAW